jgi:hypothetical protein
VWIEIHYRERRKRWGESNSPKLGRKHICPENKTLL